ncbi:hypothetical protein [Jiangella anatolica]|uniref:hypothetical protein n=1 Tax=Jiangella anatolica TaxID=2670374 RepID=UPI001314F930|nr:hypothetical protein [Jiangella anatolica]
MKKRMVMTLATLGVVAAASVGATMPASASSYSGYKDALGFTYVFKDGQLYLVSYSPN